MLEAADELTTDLPGYSMPGVETSWNRQAVCAWRRRRQHKTGTEQHGLPRMLVRLKPLLVSAETYVHGRAF